MGLSVPSSASWHRNGCRTIVLLEHKPLPKHKPLPEHMALQSGTMLGLDICPWPFEEPHLVKQPNLYTRLRLSKRSLVGEPDEVGESSHAVNH